MYLNNYSKPHLENEFVLKPISIMFFFFFFVTNAMQLKLLEISILNLNLDCCFYVVLLS